MNDSYSSWGNILFGVPQASILGPLLFNILICDMFYFLKVHGIANYTDDSTPYKAQRNHKLVIEELKKSSSIPFKWLQTNHVKLNTENSHLLLSGNTQLTLNIVGITIDLNFSFEEHINNMCKKANQKLNALARIACYMDIQKRRTIMKSFYIVSVWLLSISMDVPQQKPK